MEKNLRSTKITWNFNTKKEHTHDIGNNQERDPRSCKRDLETLGTIRGDRKVHKNNSHSSKHEHEARRKAFDNVLSVDSAGHEDNWSDGASPWILSGSDAWRFDNDIVDNAGDNHEVGEKDEGEDGHRGREGYGWEFEAEARWPEEGVRDGVDNMVEWIHGG